MAVYGRTEHFTTVASDTVASAEWLVIFRPFFVTGPAMFQAQSDPILFLMNRLIPPVGVSRSGSAPPLGAVPLQGGGNAMTTTRLSLSALAAAALALSALALPALAHDGWGPPGQYRHHHGPRDLPPPYYYRPPPPPPRYVHVPPPPVYYGYAPPRYVYAPPPPPPGANFSVTIPLR